MKKYIYSALGLFFALSSCQDPNNGGGVGKDEVSFKGQIASLTKMAGDAFEEGDEITVHATSAGQEVASANYQKVGDIFTSPSAIKKADALADYSYVATYPTMPSIGGEFVFTIESDQSTEDGFAFSDLLVVQTQSSKSMQPTLIFRHILPTMNFGFKYIDGTKATPTNVKIYSPLSVKCNIAEESYKKEGSNGKITPAVNGEDFKVVMVPQSLSTQSTFATFECDGMKYTAKFNSNTEFDFGKEYTYGFTLVEGSSTVMIDKVETSLEEWKTQASVIGAEVASKTGNNIVINVDKGSYTGNYYVGATATKYLKEGMSDAEFAEALIKDEIEIYGSDLSVVDDLMVFNKGGEISVGNNCNMVPDTEYKIVVFGIDGDGDILTNVAAITATTESVEISGSIDVEVKEIEATTIIISADPSPEVGNYIFGAVPTKQFESGQLGETKEELAYIISALYKNNGFDVAEADGEIIFNGAADIDLSEMWYIDPETSYTIVVFGVDSKGIVTSEVTMLTATTEPIKVIDSTVEISNVTAISSTEVFCDFTPGEGVKNYLFYYTPISVFDGEFESDYSVLAQSIVYTLTQYGFDISYSDGVFVQNKPRTELNITETWGEVAAGKGVNMLFTFAIDDLGNVISDFEVDYFEEPKPGASAPVRSIGKSIITEMMMNYAKPKNMNVAGGSSKLQITSAKVLR